MENPPEIVLQAMDYARQGWDLAEGWLLSPAAWSQFAILIAAYLLAVLVSRVINYSDQGRANRFEAPFAVSYNSDINLVPAIIEAAVTKRPDVLGAPYPPDCKLRAFADNGVEFAGELWVNGLDDAKNKYTSDVPFLIWNALKDNSIEIPYPLRVLHHKGLSGGLSGGLPGSAET